MSSGVTIAARPASPTIPAATGTVRSARAWPARSGSPIARPSCCRCRTSTSCSPCRRRSPRIALQNKAVVYDILFQAAAETVRTIAADPKHLGAEIGMIAVLHTWGQNLFHHPHLHCIVPGGGLSPDGRWIACRPGFFLPVRVLSRLYRRLFLERLRAAFDAGTLGSSASSAGLAKPAAFAAHLRPLRQVEWVVYAKRPFGGPQQVLDYLGRYTHRVAIANSRLIDLDRRTGPLPLEGLPASAASPR